MYSPDDLEDLLKRLEQRYDTAKVAMTAARAELAALSSLPDACPQKICAARRRVEQAEEKIAGISRKLYTIELDT